MKIWKRTKFPLLHIRYQPVCCTQLILSHPSTRSLIDPESSKSPVILDLVVEKSKPTLHHIHLLNANTGSKSASLGTDKDTDEPSLSEKVEDLFPFISLA